MSRNTRSWVVLPLTTIFALVLTLLGGISAPASAVPGDPIIPPTPSCTVTLVSGDPVMAPPAPTCYDPSGSDLDEFLVPYHVDVNGYRVAYEDGKWNPFAWDRPNLTKGASQVFVQSTYRDPASGSYVNGHSWTLQFDVTVTGVEAGSSYSATVVPGTCDPQAGMWQVSWYAYNIPDASQRYIPVVDGSVYRLADDSTLPPGMIDESLSASRVLDGQQASLGTESMYPGTYKFSATTGSVTTGWQNWRLVVPGCGKYTGPDTDEPGDPDGDIGKMPVVKLRQVSRTTMKVVVDARKVSYRVRVKVVINPVRGRTVTRAYILKPGGMLTKKYRAAPRTKFTVKAKVPLTKSGASRQPMKWKVMKKATLRKR